MIFFLPFTVFFSHHKITAFSAPVIVFLFHQIITFELLFIILFSSHHAITAGAHDDIPSILFDCHHKIDALSFHSTTVFQFHAISVILSDFILLSSHHKTLIYFHVSTVLSRDGSLDFTFT
jgi:hypothetical protein